MGQTLRIGNANELTLPDDVMRELELAPGDVVEVDRNNGTLILRKAGDASEDGAPRSNEDDPGIPLPDSLPRAYGLLHRPQQHFTDEELQAAISEARAARTKHAEQRDLDSQHR